MHRYCNFLALLGILYVVCVEAAQTRHAGALVPRNTTEPCALVSSAWAAQKAANASATPIVDGQLAYECLNSVPIHEDDALRLIRSIQTFLDWQSTTAYLRDPPEDYPFPAFDIPDAFETIADNIQSGAYANEYEFQADLFANFNKAKDGHFRFFPDLLTSVLTFRRADLALVSVSIDGTSVPQVYVLSDIRQYNANNSFIPSPVSSLNGTNTVKFIEDLSLLGALQDKDALYNTMFYSPALYASNKGDWQGYTGGSGRFGYIWPGADTTVTFENGTMANYRTIARVTGDFSGIVDGESFYDKYLTGTKPVTQVATPTTPGPTSTPTSTSSSTVAPSALGYPTPVVIASDQSAAGYYLPDSDVAVLALLTYSPNVPIEFQMVVQAFLEDAKASGKTKLIVDVSANGGGYIFQGHDTFRQLFPQIQQDGFNRFRSNEVLQIGGRQFSAAIPPGFDPETSDNDTLINLYESYQNYRFDLDVTNSSFVSVEDKFSTDEYQGDNFTQIHRWNFDDLLLTSNTTYGIGFNVTGYGNRTGFTQPFPVEDIILLYDGYCASTCTLFSEFLRIQAGVRSVTFGGRPDLDENGDIPIIQNYGGVKGSNNVAFSYINSIANASLYIQGDAPNTTSGPVGPLSAGEISVLEQNLDTYSLNRSTGTSLNVRDNILRDHLSDGLPAQFVYEAADCRLFYTPLSIIDPQEQWRQAAEAAWGTGGCVAGGLNSTSGQSLRRSGAITPEQQRRSLQRGTVISMPDLAPDKTEMWQAIHGRPVPF